MRSPGLESVIMQSTNLTFPRCVNSDDPGHDLENLNAPEPAAPVPEPASPEPASPALETCAVHPRLVELEVIVERGLETFMEVGHALWEIRLCKMYRPTYKRFEDYCRKRWGISRPRAYQLIEAAQVAENLSTLVDNQPTSERQIRPLAKLKPEQQREAWKAVTDATPTPTAEHVARVAKTITKAIEDARADTTAAVNEEQPTGGTVSQAPKHPTKPPKPRTGEDVAEFCEVGWLLLTAERDLAVAALTPANQEWETAALEFFKSLRNRKIVTVS
jgi:hypothetical protein